MPFTSVVALPPLSWQRFWVSVKSIERTCVHITYYWLISLCPVIWVFACDFVTCDLWRSGSRVRVHQVRAVHLLFVIVAQQLRQARSWNTSDINQTCPSLCDYFLSAPDGTTQLKLQVLLLLQDVTWAGGDRRGREHQLPGVVDWAEAHDDTDGPSAWRPLPS